MIGTLFGVNFGEFGITVLDGGEIFRIPNVYLGGEHWTDTLLFRFNLPVPRILLGLRQTPLGLLLRHSLLCLNLAECIASIVRRECLSRSMRAVLAKSVESKRLTFQPDVSNHLTFPFRSTLRIS